MFQAREIIAGYGELRVLGGVSIDVTPGRINALFGANGAGKTTTLGVLTGIVKAWSGEIELDGTIVTGEQADRIARRGVAMVPEGRGIFAKLSVEENLAVGAYHLPDGVLFAEEHERVIELFPRLYERRRQQAGTLSGGEQQMLAIGRALIRRPRYLLIDELSLGLAPIVVDELFAVLPKIAEADTGVLLVEQFVDRALAVADRCYVLEKGAVVTEESAATLRDNPELLRAAYLGAGATH